jgi:regulator of sirC expression with transglutaminase-like and TPR domain
LVILEPNPVREYRDRGLLHLRLENFPQALEDLETYLRLASDAKDVDEIREQVSSLKKRVTQLH